MLGIDPGLTNTGYAVAEVDISNRHIVRTLELGVLTTERDTSKKVRRTSDDLRRARELRRQIQRIVDRHGISLAACEMQTTTPYTRISLNFGILIGVIASFDFFVVEVLARQVKKAVTGDRDAPKEKIIRWALALTQNDDVRWPTSMRTNQLSINHRGRILAKAAEHPADALAAIHTALQTDQLHDMALLQRAVAAANAERELPPSRSTNGAPKTPIAALPRISKIRAA